MQGTEDLFWGKQSTGVDHFLFNINTVMVLFSSQNKYKTLKWIFQRENRTVLVCNCKWLDNPGNDIENEFTEWLAMKVEFQCVQFPPCRFPIWLPGRVVIPEIPPNWLCWSASNTLCLWVWDFCCCCF